MFIALKMVGGGIRGLFTLFIPNVVIITLGVRRLIISVFTFDYFTYI